MASNAARPARPLRPYSRPNRLQALDRRSVEHRRLQAIRDAWLAHLGGHATVAQLTLIEVIATSTLFAELIEKDAFEHHGGIMPERNAKQYAAYRNACSRAARQLGMRPATAPAPTSLADHLAARVAERQGATA